MISARAFAKLTLSLRVLGTRADGFHELDALTVSVSEPHDELTIALGNEADGVELELSGAAAAGISAGPANLAVRAAHAMLARASRGEQRVAGVRIALHKMIPAGAGLGGGSADAAAVLVALDQLLELGLPIDDIAAIGATLGSDVPFCVRGGAAHMRGRGERVEPTVVPTLYALIAVPPFAIATPAVYRAWDELGGPASARVVEGPAGVGPLTNDLEPAAERVEPRLAGFRDALERTAGSPAVLAGSGSACAVVYTEELAAAAARDRVVAAGIAATCAVGYLPC